MNDLLSNPFVRHLVWQSLVLPGMVTFVIGGVLLVVLMRQPATWNIGGLCSVPLLAGLLAGYFSVYHDWALWPRTVLGWVPLLAVITVILAGWSARHGRWIRGTVTAALVLFASGVLLEPVLRQTTPTVALREWSETAVLWWLLWMGLAGRGGAQRDSAVSQLILAAGLAVAGPLSQSLVLGQLAMVLGVVWAAVLILAWFRKGMAVSAPAAELGLMMLGMLYIELWFYAAVPGRVMLTLLIAAALGTVVYRVRQRLSILQGAGGLIIQGGATALPVAIGVYFAWLSYAASSGGY